MGEYTKGPWLRTNFTVYALQDRVWSGKPDKENRFFASVQGPKCEIAELEANARLIAAAPELLEACEEFVRKVECGEARSTRSYAQMKAAIAKAKGES